MLASESALESSVDTLELPMNPGPASAGDAGKTSEAIARINPILACRLSKAEKLIAKRPQLPFIVTDAVTS